MARHNGSESSAPPRPLGKAGRDLWDRINQDYVLADETARETLCIICETADHAAPFVQQLQKRWCLSAKLIRAHAPIRPS